MKPLLREMVLSATYRQDHTSTPELSEMDPKNLLLARGPNAFIRRDGARQRTGCIRIISPS